MAVTATFTSAAAADCEPQWANLASGGQVGVDGSVRALTVWNGDLIVGGTFTTAGGQTVNRIARWDGLAWHPFIVGGTNGVDNTVMALIEWNGDLIVAGPFTTAGGQTVNRIARWDGSAWHPFVSPGGQVGMSSPLSALAVWNGDLIAGGDFSSAGGESVNRIARWDGSAWHPFVSGGQIGVNGRVTDLALSGGDLIAGGWFTMAGGQEVNRIARWDGSSGGWHPFESGGEIGVNGDVDALVVYDGDLIAAGSFFTAGGQTVNRIARWDGAQWQPLASGGQIGMNFGVVALTVYDGELIAGGHFTTAGGQTVNRIARWDGCPSGEPQTLEVPSQHPTIQAAIDAASVNNGDTILVAPGTYNEAITYNGKTITVKSSRGTAVTTIDASGLNQTAVLVPGGSGEGTRLEGFTIAGGNALPGGIQTDYGGGIRIDAGGGAATITVADCHFTGNTAEFAGGGAAALWAANVTFEDCTFTANESQFGGGAAVAHGGGDAEPTMTFINCTFDGNTTLSSGGALSVNAQAHAVLLDCNLTNNQAWSGGGIFAGAGTTVQITGSAIVSNTADSHGGGVHVGGPAGDIPAPVVNIASTEVCNNSPNDFSGEPWYDLGGNTIGEACDPPGIPGDLTGNGSVGVADLLILLGAWGPCADCAPGNCPADLTGDCNVGVADLLVLLGNWG